MAYGRLPPYGVRIFEYEPGMLHAKILLINDDGNVAVDDPGFAARLENDFAADLADAREITFEEWKGRSALERGPELLGWILERQQ